MECCKTFTDESESRRIHDPDSLNDHEYSGDAVIGTAGETLAFREGCYRKSDGKFWKWDADAEGTTEGIIVLCMESSLAADARGVFLEDGYVRDDTDNWTVGGLLYPSCTAGALTQTNPAGEGDIIRKVGWAWSADITRFWGNPHVLIEQGA